MAKYQQTEQGKKVVRQGQRAWAERNPEKRRAQVVVSNALRDGRLVRGRCERAGGECRGKIQAHHDDYAKPLAVRWLCDGHHRVVHRELVAQ